MTGIMSSYTLFLFIMNNYREARQSVSKLIGIELRKLTYILYEKKTHSFYSTFIIPKKNGGNRKIYAPDDELKLVQKKLANKLHSIHAQYLEDNNIKSVISHGFEKDKNIISNAYIHKNKRFVLNVDISNFFDSFHFGRVKGFFIKNKAFNFSDEESTILAQLVCYNGKLPQGAPTSPLIANLIFNIADLQILKLARAYKLNYTRYADDLSFSTNIITFGSAYSLFLEELSSILIKNGFKLNEDKTRLQFFSSRQEVTGITVNQKLNVSKKFIKDTRAMADKLYKTDEFQINGTNGTLNQLEGRFSFINQLDWFNNKCEYKINNNSLKKKYFRGLNAREKQFQIFLFYKYFYNPDKVTLVTEGKTDIIHVKAALKKYYNKYPELIVKKGDEFEFKINFLKRTDRLAYFLGIVSDGADTMKNIWNFYTGHNNHYNINDYLENKSLHNIKRVNRKPSILLFDNEQIKGKPLDSFLKYTNLKLKDNQISIKLISNLYLQTFPLISNMREAEIEDLYSTEVLNTEIRGKTFKKDKKINKNKKKNSDNDPESSNKHYGKHIFSQYIKENYASIDFTNFIPLLDSINTIVMNNK